MHPDEQAAREALEQTGLEWRPWGRDELPEVASFYEEVEAFDRNSERTSLAGLQDFWDSPRSVPEQDTLVGRDASGRVLATAWSGCNRSITEARTVFLSGAVHPELRRRGIGRRVLAWELTHGRAWDAATREPGFGPLRMRLLAPIGQQDVRHLAERHGLPVVRHFHEMSRPLCDLPERRVPDGIRLADWDAGRSGELRQVVNSAFRDHWGHVDASEQMWADQVNASDFRPGWSVLALDGERVVGVAMNCAYEQDWSEGHREGCTDQLGVLRGYRGRGIATALLVESMHRFAADGMDAASLGVDTHNPSGALRLYQALDYRTTASTCLHQVEEHQG